MIVTYFVQKLQAKKAAEKQHVLPVNVPVVTRRKNCELKPFSFDAKDKERFAKKEEKIQEIIQKEKEVNCKPNIISFIFMSQVT